MAQSKPKVGDLIEVKEGGVVRRPDGEPVTVTGGSYVLTQTGTYDVDGTEMEVRA
jgi:hypothetical protein